MIFKPHSLSELHQFVLLFRRVVYKDARLTRLNWTRPSFGCGRGLEQGGYKDVCAVYKDGHHDIPFKCSCVDFFFGKVWFGFWNKGMHPTIDSWDGHWSSACIGGTQSGKISDSAFVDVQGIKQTHVKPSVLVSFTHHIIFSELLQVIFFAALATWRQRWKRWFCLDRNTIYLNKWAIRLITWLCWHFGGLRGWIQIMLMTLDFSSCACSRVDHLWKAMTNDK